MARTKWMKALALLLALASLTINFGLIDLIDGYTGFDPAEFADRDRLRAELGYHPDEAVCIVTSKAG